MADNGRGEHGGDPESSRQRLWVWGSSAGLGIMVGLLFGMAFVPMLGGFGIAIGIAFGVGLVPAFAMTTPRPADPNQRPADPDQGPTDADQDPRERD
jgi:hypothetical protein